MGEEVADTTFSREDRQRYRDKVKRCLDVFARMLAEARFDAEQALDRAGDRAQPHRRGRRPGDGQRRRARADRRRRLPDRARAVQHRDQHPAAACSRAAVFSELEEPSARASTTPRSRRAGRRAHDDHRDPPDAHRAATSTREALSANPRYELLNEQIFAARGEDLRDRDRRRRAARDLRRHDRARGGVHERPAAPAGRSRRVRARTGTRRRRSPACSSRSARTRRSSSARSCGARRASRCSSRPPTRARRSSRPRACARACGSASAGSRRSSTCSRRTSATSRRCCRCARTRTRWRCSSAATRRSCSELRLHNGTIYRWNRPIYDVVRGRPHLRVENRVLPAGPTVVDIARQRRLLLRAGAHAGRGASGRCGRRCRSRRPRRTSTRARATGIDARVYWPGVGEVPGVGAGAAAAAADGPRGARRAGASTRPTPTGCWRSSSAAASTQRNGAVVAGRGVPPALRRRLDRADALREMTVRYREHMHSNEPVHTWPLPS